MFKKILVPLDGSPLSELALPYVESIARQLNAEVNVIRVLNFNLNDAYPHKSDQYKAIPIECAEGEVKKYFENLGIDVENPNFEILLGQPAEAIAEYADNQNVDLIVMSTHGRSGISRWAMGSIADKVIRMTLRPIMLIRAKNDSKTIRKEYAFRKILVPLDGSIESESVIPYVKRLCSNLNATVILLNVICNETQIYAEFVGPVQIPFTEDEINKITEDKEVYLASFKEQFESVGINTQIQIRYGREADEIINTADEIEADLIAMSTHGRSGIKRWIIGSIASKILHAGNTPLLLVRSVIAEKKECYADIENQVAINLGANA